MNRAAFIIGCVVTTFVVVVVFVFCTPIMAVVGAFSEICHSGKDAADDLRKMWTAAPQKPGGR